MSLSLTAFIESDYIALRNAFDQVLDLGIALLSELQESVNRQLLY